MNETRVLNNWAKTLGNHFQAQVTGYLSFAKVQILLSYLLCDPKQCINYYHCY